MGRGRVAGRGFVASLRSAAYGVRATVTSATPTVATVVDLPATTASAASVAASAAWRGSSGQHVRSLLSAARPVTNATASPLRSVIAGGSIDSIATSVARRRGASVRHSLASTLSAIRPQASAGSTSTLGRRGAAAVRPRRGYEIDRLAQEHPDRANIQASYLRVLNARSPNEVVRRVESGQYAINEEGLVEYIKALVALNRFSANKFTEVFNVWASGRGVRGAPATTEEYLSVLRKTMNGSSSSATAAAAGAAPEETKKAILWRAVRGILWGFLIISAFAAIFEERGGLGRVAGIAGGSKPIPSETPEVRFADVQGVDDAKEDLEEIVEYLRDPDGFSRLGGRLPKGVLLTGSPGTGKTLLARAVAGESGVPFFYVSGSEFDEMFVGVGARRVRDLFAQAKKHAPSIIFIDEIDAVGSKRNPADQSHYRMTLNQLLVEMDGFTANDNVIVIGSTNFAESLDSALVRPGRFDKEVVVALPDVRGREKILALYVSKIAAADDVDVAVLARGTPGFTGADLENMVNIAAVAASKDKKEVVSMADLDGARDRVLMGSERKSFVMSDENRKLVAFHEGGHAVVAFFTPNADPLYKATIMPRGQALGMVTQLPEKDSIQWSRAQLLARMDVCMAGRVSEELNFGPENVTSGASSDFQQATNIAEQMVRRFGMSDKVGVATWDPNAKLSGSTQALIEDEINRILDESYERAKECLVTHRAALTAVAEALLEHETLDATQLADIIGAAGKRGWLSR